VGHLRQVVVRVAIGHLRRAAVCWLSPVSRFIVS
jgi:hypothetical protein